VIFRTRHALCLWLGLASGVTQAEIVDIAWNSEGRFERRVTVAPGTFTEVCGRLARNDTVAWRFEAAGPLNFNIHLHVGQDVHYPERRDAVSAASGQLRVSRDNDHCWMWANKASQPVELKLVLSR
jgi:hypothetical protein